MNVLIQEFLISFGYHLPFVATDTLKINIGGSLGTSKNGDMHVAHEQKKKRYLFGIRKNYAFAKSSAKP